MRGREARRGERQGAGRTIGAGGGTGAAGRRTGGGHGGLLLLGLAGCAPPPPSGLPAAGRHPLTVPGTAATESAAAGQLVVGADWRGRPTAKLRLVGPTWMTPGLVTARIESGELGGAPVSWLHFPLRTAVGEAEAVLRVQGASALLPLGARPGEHEVALRIGPAGALPPVDAGPTEARLADLAAAWGLGRFRLLAPGAGPDATEGLVGEVLLQGELPPLVAVYDGLWLSPGPVPVPALREDQGGDMVLGFPVEPALQGEQGLLRVNVPTQTVTVPLGPTPDPQERQLILAPGEVSDEERAIARARARRAADLAEQAWLEEVGPRLAAALQAPEGGGCRPLDSLGPDWGLVTAGYELTTTVAPEGAGCVLWIEPVVEQHRRRLRAELRPGAPPVLTAPH